MSLMYSLRRPCLRLNMPTARETILTALADLVRTMPQVPVLCDAVLPERVPAAGLLILRDGEPGEPEVTLSPLRYHYEGRGGGAGYRA